MQKSAKTRRMIVYMDAPVTTRASTAAMTIYLQSSNRRNKIKSPIDSKVFRQVVQGVVGVLRQSAERVAGRRRVEPKKKEKKLEESLLLPVHYKRRKGSYMVPASRQSVVFVGLFVSRSRE